MSHPEVLYDLEIPSYLTDLLKQENIDITYWGKFKRRPKFSKKEKFICVFEGTEEFKLVHFMFKNEVRAGTDKELRLEDTPLDFFTDESLKDRKVVLTARLKRGDCLYIPAFYWYQSQSIPEHENDIYPRVSFITINFKAHSVLTDLLV